MDLNLKLLNQKLIELNEKKEDKDGNKPDVVGEQTSEPEKVLPESKPVTASIQDVLASYAQGTVQFVSTTGNKDIPLIDEGVTEFIYDDSEIITYNSNGYLSIQIKGDLEPDDLLKKIPNLQPLAPDYSGVTNSINGEIDEKVSQGNNTGDCWVLAGVLALNATDVGKQILKNCIKPNPDGSVTIEFKGLNVSYTITADEINKHDTDSNKNDPYSNGDNDMLALELATVKLMADIASGKIKLDVPADSPEAIYNKDGSIEGGFAQNMIYYLTGETADFIYAYGREVQGLPEGEVISFLSEAYKNGNSALTFGIYGAPHRAKLVDGTSYKLDISGGHALSITNLTATTVTFVNPWDSMKQYTMTWDEFAKLGVGMLTATDLSDLVGETPKPPVDPSIPVDPIDPNPIEPGMKIYTKDDLYAGRWLPQSQIDKFFEPVNFKADGTPTGWVLKEPYTDIKMIGGHGLIDKDGERIMVEFALIVTSKDENGNEVKESFSFYSKTRLSSYLGGTWWQRSEYVNKYFEVDKESGLYMLKPGMSLQDLKNEQPREAVKKDDPADPSSWINMINRNTGERIYNKIMVEGNLSQGVVAEFFEAEIGTDGKTYGYTLKAPYTGIKLVSNGENERVYEFSYTKDGKKYTATVTINETDGSYSVKDPSVESSSNGKIYKEDDLRAGLRKLPQSQIDKFFEPVNFKADGTPTGWVLKEPYTDIKMIGGHGLIDKDGERIMVEFALTVTSKDENGNEVKESYSFYSKTRLSAYLGGTWWQRSEYVNKYFEVDKESGLYMLKPGMSLQDLKNEQPREAVKKDDPADPSSWINMINRNTGERIYNKMMVEENLSQGVVAEFFEAEIGTDGKTYGYTLKAPYTGIKLVSNGENERVYEFSYTKDGKKYTATVTINETDGSYSIRKSVIKKDNFLNDFNILNK